MAHAGPWVSLVTQNLNRTVLQGFDLSTLVPTAALVSFLTDILRSILYEVRRSYPTLSLWYTDKCPTTHCG